MKRGILALLVVVIIAVLIAVIVGNKKKNDPVKQQPVAVSKHSAQFNTSFDKALDTYAALTEAFVNWDTAAIDKKAAAMEVDLKGLNLEELKKDTVIYQTAASYLDGFASDLTTIQNDPDIAAKRQAFHSFSQNFYDLLRTVHYDRSKIYLQECPMAFNNETEAGMWLSRQEAIRNPYMGLHHPKYGKAMIECGDIKDTLNFTAPATK